MRWVPALFFLLPSVAAADQTDPALSGLFEALRAGEGNVEELQSQIETTWLTPGQTGIGVLTQRAVQALAAGDRASAEILVGHVTDLAPHFAEGWVLKAELAVIADDPMQAAAAFSRAVELEPRHYNALSRLGDLALAAGDRDLAHRRYREALHWNPHMSDVRARADDLRRRLGGQEI